MNINERIQELQNEISHLKLQKKYQAPQVDRESIFFETKKYQFFKQPKNNQSKQSHITKSFSLSKAVFG